MMSLQFRHCDLAQLMLLTANAACLLPGCDTSETIPRSYSDETSPASTSETGISPPPAAPPAGVLPHFVMMGKERGLEFERFDDIRGEHRMIESNGGGVALFDFDRDGWPDVLLTNGCPLPAGLTSPEYQSSLFRNLAGERFSQVTKPAAFKQHGYCCGCAVGDYDADGFDDLYITAFGRNTLWKNNGDGTFSDVSDGSVIDRPVWSTSAAFADIDSDGDLDLFVVNYLDESAGAPRLCPHPTSPTGYVACSPAVFDGVDDVLYLSDGSGGFSDVTDRYGLKGQKGKGLGVVISNLNGDLRPEIYVANDGEANFLWVAEPDTEGGGSLDRSPSPWKYADRALPSGTALNESGFAQASMGIAAGDCNGDGTIDLFLTHFIDDTNTLYANRGGLVFEDVTRASRLGNSSFRKLGFGTMFLDVDNNGLLDLFVANGHVEDLTWLREGIPYHMPPELHRNSGDGTFEDVSLWSGDYFTRKWIGRGAACGDVNRDGRIDLAVSHQLAPSLVLRNETDTEGAAIVLQFAGTRSNRNGFNARVELTASEKTFVRELTPGISFQSACLPELHFGLGTDIQADIKVFWPSGQIDAFSDVAPGRSLIVEGQGLYAMP